jgi:enoyl-CoA hydratase/carnithine racemase
MPKPVICQIHRACFGGALEVALGCDLRIASDDAQLGLPEVKFGIIPDVGGSTRLPAVVGLGRAKELIMTARTIDAAEAQSIGLLNRVVPATELEATQVLVDELLANSHVAVGRAKRVMDASARPTLAQTLELEVSVQEYCVAAMREGAREAGEAAEAETVAAG